jgi:hypothetical protein
MPFTFHESVNLKIPIIFMFGKIYSLIAWNNIYLYHSLPHFSSVFILRSDDGDIGVTFQSMCYRKFYHHHAIEILGERRWPSISICPSIPIQRFDVWDSSQSHAFQWKNRYKWKWLLSVFFVRTFFIRNFLLNDYFIPILGNVWHVRTIKINQTGKSITHRLL